MPTYLHPGVYVEEIPSGAKPIEGVGWVKFWASVCLYLLVDEQKLVPVHHCHAVKLDSTVSRDAIVGLQIIDQSISIPDLIGCRLAGQHCLYCATYDFSIVKVVGIDRSGKSLGLLVNKITVQHRQCLSRLQGYKSIFACQIRVRKIEGGQQWC